MDALRGKRTQRLPQEALRSNWSSAPAWMRRARSGLVKRGAAAPSNGAVDTAADKEDGAALGQVEQLEAQLKLAKHNVQWLERRLEWMRGREAFMRGSSQGVNAQRGPSLPSVSKSMLQRFFVEHRRLRPPGSTLGPRAT